MIKEELNFAKNEDFALTMIPGKFAKAMRTCKIWQLFRFAVINVKMLIVVSKSH
jgi:ABC-type transport system involved in cytochrome c biogenesis permease subunit